ncbi:metal-dependent hydrolase [Catenovulum sp. SM1970]|uniref:metal-dependent hydrolase n=1 Tax=Marinifaba aquimaris TaxID=2741323 RepID=UPI001572B83E|nr:metal-dependent hydrolase [Marinifaba aquimaris]NTS78372.1 metal-dependent hydrolase [Marinifaba aquimaris]
MDSLTQFALGAAVGEAVLGKKLGNKAMLWGGICGTIPDLDVFIPMGNAVADFTYHRSFSHSLFVLALLTPLVAWLGMKIHKQPDSLKRRWWMMVYLVFATHVLLDSFTAYGTQIFWPFFSTPMTWSSLFIIDPLYTVPLLVGLIAILIKRSTGTEKWNLWGVGLSSLYLSWSIGAKVYVDEKMHQGLKEQGVENYSLFSTPAPFNTLLWRGIAKTDKGYYEVYYSVFDKQLPSDNAFFISDENLLSGMSSDWSIARLQWFSKGFYAVKQQDEQVIISDLRMGLEPDYVFQFAVAKIQGDSLITIDAEQLAPERDLSILNTVWRRIWSEEVQI